MEENKLVAIDDFIMIETVIGDNVLETSLYSGVEDFFGSHLSETNANRIQQLSTTDVYCLKIGDTIKVFPTTWATEFTEEKKLPSNDSYDFAYKIIDVIVEFYSKNPNSDNGLPKINLKLCLEKVK